MHAEQCAIGYGVARGKHLAACAIEEHGDRSRGCIGSGRRDGERIEAGDTDNRQPRGERKPLDRCETHAQPGEWAGPESHCQQRDVAKRQARRIEHGEDLTRQAHAMRPRSVACVRMHDGPITAQRHAAVGRRRVKSERHHDLYTILPGILPAPFQR